MPKISIISANRNCDKWLGAMIESVQNQKFDDYEHIIIDDCSTDRSRRVLKNYAHRDGRIKILKAKKRLRCGSAYAQIASIAQGDIVGVLDSDDCLAEGAMKTIFRLYEKYPDVGYIWTQFLWCDSRMKNCKQGMSCHPGNQSLLDAGLKERHCFSHWRTFRRSIIGNHGGLLFKEGLKSAVDKYMGYALEELAVGGFIDRILYKYRQRISGNLSNTGRRNWERMKRKFNEKRIAQNIKPFPIKTLEI